MTIIEGETVAMAFRRIAEADILEGPLPPPPPEGSLLPDTYLVTRGTTRAALVARMQQARDDLLQDLWANRAPDLPFNTPEEAINLASIVEKETGSAEERPLVASVFVNRLRRGMKLESDPTIIYGLTGGEPLGRGIRRSELDGETPYNTYFIPALPPTPICNPGREAIAAVLNPPDSDYLFFVAVRPGETRFSATYAQHRRYVAELRRNERAARAGRP